MTKIYKTFFTLGEITTILRVVIKREKLYEERNRKVIICSEELKLALKCDSLHLSELKKKLLTHLTLAPEYLRDGENPSNNLPTGSISVYILKKAKFKLRRPFCELIQKVNKFNRNRTVFTYKEVCFSLSKYINDRRYKFFQGQNKKIA